MYLFVLRRLWNPHFFDSWEYNIVSDVIEIICASNENWNIQLITLQLDRIGSLFRCDNTRLSKMRERDSVQGCSSLNTTVVLLVVVFCDVHVLPK